jgi:hypothetical protein
VQPKTLSVRKRYGIIKVSSPDVYSTYVYRRRAWAKKAPPKRVYLPRTSENARGCQMSAYNNQHHAAGKHLTGRRISLEGGNRGMRQRGQTWRSYYGDLSVNFPVQIGKAAGHQAANDF